MNDVEVNEKRRSERHPQQKQRNRKLLKDKIKSIKF